MKVLAINGSPRAEKGNTALILEPFLDGMKAGGAEVDLAYTKTMNILPCQGDYHCWFKKPGVCFQTDDMDELLPKLCAADVLVLATPLYVDGMTGPLKNLLDRVIPIADPTIELREGRCRHPAREGVKKGKIVLVSNCGFWGEANFEPLLAHIQAIGANLSREFAGALLRPHGAALKAMMDQGMSVDPIFDAAREAGRQLAETGVMEAETLEKIRRPLIPQEPYVAIVNQYIHGLLAKC